jgi:hypothetical protein
MVIESDIKLQPKKKREGLENGMGGGVGEDVRGMRESRKESGNGMGGRVGDSCQRGMSDSREELGIGVGGGVGDRCQRKERW